MTMRNALQYVQPATDYTTAAETAKALGTLDGCILARVIGDGGAKPWAAQGLYELDTIPAVVPDGCRVVTVTDSMLANMKGRAQ